MRMMDRYKLSGLHAFLDFLAERGFSVQVPRDELDNAIAAWLDSYNPSYVRQFKKALELAKLIKPRAGGRIFDIKRRDGDAQAVS